MCTYIGHHFWWESQNFADGEVEQRNDSFDGDSSWLVHVVFAQMDLKLVNCFLPAVATPRFKQNNCFSIRSNIAHLNVLMPWWRFFSLRLCTLGLFVRPQHIAGGFTGSFTLTSFGWNLVADCANSKSDCANSRCFHLLSVPCFQQPLETEVCWTLVKCISTKTFIYSICYTPFFFADSRKRSDHLSLHNIILFQYICTYHTSEITSIHRPVSPRTGFSLECSTVWNAMWVQPDDQESIETCQSMSWNLGLMICKWLVFTVLMQPKFT